jgi:hypothetical protein
MTNEQHEFLGGVAARGFSVARRTFVFLGALAFAGCATSQAQRLSRLPDPDWPPIPDPPAGPAKGSGAVAAAPAPAPQGATGRAAAVEEACDDGVCWLPGNPVPWALPRSMWTDGRPDTSDMERMLPVKYITIHHDGLTPFYGISAFESKARLELIRNGHRGKGWADIGYHYVIDRSGRVWQGRDVTKWQGAHVKNRNEGNVGVLCMGNFCEQRPSAAQLVALNRAIAQLRTYYRVSNDNVFTHKEWPGAQTLCPGPNLQVQVAAMRKKGFSKSAIA